ncbi:MAG: hypothetical protein ACRDTD_14355 [Pseudonocardiaceae bacterium]
MARFTSSDAAHDAIRFHLDGMRQDGKLSPARSTRDVLRPHEEDHARRFLT